MAAIQEVADLPSLEAGLLSLKPTILFLDLTLPGFDPITGVVAVQRLSSSTNIVLFSQTTVLQEAVGAIRAGARGYCKIDIDPALLRKAAERIQAGDIWVSRGLIASLLGELGAATKAHLRNRQEEVGRRLALLTPREREVAHLVSDGSSNKDIANRLAIAEKTVKAHLTTIFQKLGVSGRLRLALLVTAANTSTRPSD
jgi:DNA-binding NarL/FixJ family response regulator